MKTASHRPLRLGDLQLRILKALWRQPRATVAQVRQSLEASPPLAYTTVATMLRKMEARGLVRHRAEGRVFLFSAALAEEEVARSLTGHLLDRLFQGSLSSMVSHLLDHRQLSAGELDQLQKLIAAHKRKSK